MVISSSTKGRTNGEISAHFSEVYGAQAARQTISTITDKVVEGVLEWRNRPAWSAGAATHLAGQLQPASPGLPHQLLDKLLIQAIQPHPGLRLLNVLHARSHLGHQIYSHDWELHRASYSPLACSSCL
jgi:mutator family transposase